MSSVNTRNRIEWIDAIRGIAIILVVYYHILLFCIGHRDEFFNTYFIRFRMPLFFFISGFFVWSPDYSFGKLIRRSKNRLLRQFWPTVLISAIFILTLYNGTLLNFIYSYSKGGYWFTFVVVEMFLLVAPILFLMNSINLNRGGNRLYY